MDIKVLKTKMQKDRLLNIGFQKNGCENHAQKVFHNFRHVFWRVFDHINGQRFLNTWSCKTVM